MQAALMLLALTLLQCNRQERASTAELAITLTIFVAAYEARPSFGAPEW